MIDRAITVITLELFLAVCLEMLVIMPKYKNIFSKQDIHCSWHVADELVINVNYTPQTLHSRICFLRGNHVLIGKLRILKKKKKWVVCLHQSSTYFTALRN